MSFDIFFMPCRFAEKPVETIDPKSGQPKKKLPNEPLTPDELAAVQRIVADATAASAESGGGVARFADSGYAEIYGGDDLQNGCMVALRGAMTPDVLMFLFDLLRAGNWAMIPAMRETRAIAASSDAFRRIPEGLPEPLVCESAGEIGVLLEKGFGEWKAYRDYVVKKTARGDGVRPTDSPR